MSDISILPAAHECPDCGTTCEAVVTYDPTMCERVDAWLCPDCEAHFYRETHGSVRLRGLAKHLSSLRRGND